MKWLLLCIFLYSLPCYAQTGARSYAMAGASVFDTDAWATRNNPAGLAGVSGFSAGGCSTMGYLITSLLTHQLAVAVSHGGGAFGGMLQQRGWGDFREGSFSLGYGRMLKSGFRAGMHADYVHRSVRNHLREGALSIGMGIQVRIGADWWLGSYVQNPIVLRWPDAEPLPTFMRIGFQWEASANARLFVELEKGLFSPLIIRAGLEYTLNNHFFLRFGSSSGAEALSFGFGYEHKGNVQFQVANSWHLQLGWSPALGVLIVPGQRQDSQDAP